MWPVWLQDTWEVAPPRPRQGPHGEVLLLHVREAVRQQGEAVGFFSIDSSFFQQTDAVKKSPKVHRCRSVKGSNFARHKLSHQKPKKEKKIGSISVLKVVIITPETPTISTVISSCVEDLRLLDPRPGLWLPGTMSATSPIELPSHQRRWRQSFMPSGTSLKRTCCKYCISWNY